MPFFEQLDRAQRNAALARMTVGARVFTDGVRNPAGRPRRRPIACGNSKATGHGPYSTRPSLSARVRAHLKRADVVDILKET